MDRKVIPLTICHGCYHVIPENKPLNYYQGDYYCNACINNRFDKIEVIEISNDDISNDFI